MGSRAILFKAFSILEWHYLADLSGFSVWPFIYTNWVRLLYKTFKAKVILNKCSEIFPLAWGMRNGCPLSPLFFALAMGHLLPPSGLHPMFQDFRGHLGKKQLRCMWTMYCYS